MLWQILEQAQDGTDGRFALLRRPDRLLAESLARQIELAASRGAHRLDDGIVPHPSAIEKSCRYKERRMQPKAPQDRERDRRIVGISVVERNGERARRNRAAVKRRNGFIQRQHIEPVAHASTSARRTRQRALSFGNSGSGRARTR